MAKALPPTAAGISHANTGDELVDVDQPLTPGKIRDAMENYLRERDRDLRVTWADLQRIGTEDPR